MTSIQKNSEKFKPLKFNFSAVCLSETFIQQKIQTIGFVDINLFIKLEMVSKEEGSAFFFRNTLSYKIRSDLNIISDEIWFLCLKISNKSSKNAILSLNYRPPNDDKTLYEKHMKSILSKNDVIKGGDTNQRFQDKSSWFW